MNVNAADFARIARVLSDMARGDRALVYQTGAQGLVWMFPGVIADSKGRYPGAGASVFRRRGFAWHVKVGVFTHRPEGRDEFNSPLPALIKPHAVSQFDGPLEELEGRLRQYQYPSEQMYMAPFLRRALDELIKAGR